MRAIILAAGRGTRLFGAEGGPPKCLLEFGERSLLSRHLDVLSKIPVIDITVVVGHQAGLIEAEISRHRARDLVNTIYNAEYQDGAIVSMAASAPVLRSGEAVIFMDADILCASQMIDRLVALATGNALTCDRRFTPGEDPVMVCINAGVVTDLGKELPGEFDEVSEWPGVLKLDAEIASLLGDMAIDVVRTGGRFDPYEVALRRLLNDLRPGWLDLVDVSDLP